AVDKADLFLQNAKDRLVNNKEKVLKAQAPAAEAESDIARLEKELVHAKKETAKLYGATAGSINATQLMTKLAEAVANELEQATIPPEQPAAAQKPAAASGAGRGAEGGNPSAAEAPEETDEAEFDVFMGSTGPGTRKADAPNGSGSLDAEGESGHQLRTCYGHKVCVRCGQHAKDIKGKYRGLGTACEEAKTK
ncbi:unnamed protein product, partial [Prorocentrum cordatum]